MAKLKQCPFCQQSGGVRYISEISTWTVSRYVCRNCKHAIEIKTTMGKVNEISGIVLTGAVLIKLLNNPTDIDPSDFDHLF